MRFLRDWRLKYLVLALFLSVSLVFFFWGIRNGSFSAATIDSAYWEQAARRRITQGIGIALVGGVLFIGLMIRDRRAPGGDTSK